MMVDKYVLLGADKVVFVSVERAKEAVLLMVIVMAMDVMDSVVNVDSGLLDVLDVVNVVEDRRRERRWNHHAVTSRHGHTIIGQCHILSRHHGQRCQATQGP